MTSEPPTAPPAPPGTPTPRRRLPSAGVILVAVLVSALIGVSTFAVVEWRSHDTTKRRVARLEQQLNRRGSAPGATSSSSADPLDELQRLLGTLGQLGGGSDAQCASDLLGDPSTLGSAEIPASDARAQITAIADWVERERGLRFTQRPEPKFVTAAQMQERVRANIERDYPTDQADLDGRLLTALGAIESGTDLRVLQADLVSGQVAGFYDTATKELVVLADDPSAPLGLVEEVTLAHELEHALADQNLTLPVDDKADPTASDAQAAALALVEGDATLTMQRFTFAAMSGGSVLDDLGSLLESSLGDQQAALAEAPHFLQRELLFPYEDGLGFVCDRYTDGGWKRVDDAYHAPPTTTAQILFPARYRANEGATDAPDPGPLGGSWTRARASTLGAAALEWLFEAPGDHTGRALDHPLDRVKAWAGGEVVQWVDGNRNAIGISLTQHKGSTSLCGSIRSWYRAAFPDAHTSSSGGDALVADGATQDAVLRCSGDTVSLGLAPDVATARTLAREPAVAT